MNYIALAHFNARISHPFVNHSSTLSVPLALSLCVYLSWQIFLFSACIFEIHKWHFFTVKIVHQRPSLCIPIDSLILSITHSIYKISLLYFASFNTLQLIHLFAQHPFSQFKNDCCHCFHCTDTQIANRENEHLKQWQNGNSFFSKWF